MDDLEVPNHDLGNLHMFHMGDDLPHVTGTIEWDLFTLAISRSDKVAERPGQNWENLRTKLPPNWLSIVRDNQLKGRTEST